MTRREQCEYVYRGFQHDGRQIVEHADIMQEYHHICRFIKRLILEAIGLIISFLIIRLIMI